MSGTEEYVFETFDEMAVKLKEMFQMDDYENLMIRRSPMGLYFISTEDEQSEPTETVDTLKEHYTDHTTKLLNKIYGEEEEKCVK